MQKERGADRLVRLLPYPDRLVVRARRDERPSVADRERPDLAVVTLELLNALELQHWGIRSLKWGERRVKGKGGVPCRRPST